MACTKSEEETWLNYTFQPFSSCFLMEFLPYKCLRQKTHMPFSLQSIRNNLSAYLPIIMHTKITFSNCLIIQTKKSL